MNIYAPLEHMGVPMAVQASVLAAALLLLTGWLIRRELETAGGGVLPDEGISLRNVVEFVMEALANLARENIGPEWRSWFPVIATIFFFILVSNLLGLLPAVGGATSNVNVTIAWAVISFAVYNYVGIRAHGARYVKQFLGPMPLLSPLFLLLEPVLHLARIVTLAVRLFANMFADHTIIAVWILLAPFAVPALFYGLGLLVSVLQAFVFALLTIVYISLALEEEH